MLLHLLTFCQFLLLLHFVFGVLCDTLDDRQSNFLIFLNIFVLEVIEDCINRVLLTR